MNQRTQYLRDARSDIASSIGNLIIVDNRHPLLVSLNEAYRALSHEIDDQRMEGT